MCDEITTVRCVSPAAAAAATASPAAAAAAAAAAPEKLQLTFDTAQNSTSSFRRERARETERRGERGLRFI